MVKVKNDMNDTESNEENLRREAQGSGREGQETGNLEAVRLRSEAPARHAGRKRAKRPRCDTAVRQLSAEQRSRVDAWLFDGNMSYREVITLGQKELGTTLSLGALSRYFQQEVACGRRRKEPEGGNSYISLLESMIEAALRAAQTVEIGNDPRALAAFARVMVAARQEANEALRASTTREKFEFDAATACLIHQVKVKSIAEDEALDDGERILKIREAMFGPNLPS